MKTATFPKTISPQRNGHEQPGSNELVLQNGEWIPPQEVTNERRCAGCALAPFNDRTGDCWAAIRQHQSAIVLVWCHACATG